MRDIWAADRSYYSSVRGVINVSEVACVEHGPMRCIGIVRIEKVGVGIDEAKNKE